LFHIGTGIGIKGTAVLAKALKRGEGEGGLRQALREARLAEAAHFDATLELRDSKSIRLQLLKEDLMPAISSSAAAAELFDLALVPGEQPRLWIDLVSYVVMEPDPRTYRLLHDRQDSREILFESDNREQVADFIRKHMAHRLIARERQAAGTAANPTTPGYSASSLVLAWTSGFALGALVLMALSIYLKNITF
jgi:hypothetical protein